jgi:hypothetical protein
MRDTRLSGAKMFPDMKVQNALAARLSGVGRLKRSCKLAKFSLDRLKEKLIAYTFFTLTGSVLYLKTDFRDVDIYH